MKKMYFTILTLLSVNLYSQYITNSSSVANYTTNLRHNGTLSIGDQVISDISATPLQIKYSTNKLIHIPIYNSQGGFQLIVSSCNSCFSPTAKPGDGIIKVMSGKNIIFAYGSTVNSNSLPNINGVQRYIFEDNSIGASSQTMSVYNTGKVTMGTDKYDLSGYRLFVKDGIKTEKLKVEIASTNQWADYVFNEEYNLMPLNEVKTFIDTNKHLPNIPSAKQIVSDGGIEQGELNAKLLEKIEELTLYLIKQNEKIDQLTQEINQLKRK